MTKLGNLLKKRRKLLNLSTRDVARDTGSSNLCRYENGKSMPSFAVAVDLAKYYDLDIREMAKMVL